jgi:hypothetical protein
MVGAGALVICGLPSVAGAAAPTTSTFTLTGSVSGTLTMANGPCDEIGGYGGEFAYYQKLSGSSAENAKNWTVNVNALGHKKGGTFTKMGGLLGNGVSIVLSGSNGKQDYLWASKSGKIVTTTTSGTANVLLVPDRSFTGKPGKGNIQIKGSWGCNPN